MKEGKDKEYPVKHLPAAPSLPPPNGGGVMGYCFGVRFFNFGYDENN